MSSELIDSRVIGSSEGGSALAAGKTAREKVLDVASILFYAEGVRAVGIDTIVARSGVAKMSLYRNFASKDDLVVAYLVERNRRFFEWWERATAPDDGPPVARLRALIAATIEKVGRPEFRGCAFLNTCAEYPDAAHPARAIIEGHKREVRARLLELARALPAKNPEALVTQLIALMDGIYAYPATVAEPDGARALIDAFDALIGAQTPHASPRVRR
jgi:AcrR family transcriptional regulator